MGKVLMGGCYKNNGLCESDSSIAQVLVTASLQGLTSCKNNWNNFFSCFFIPWDLMSFKCHTSCKSNRHNFFMFFYPMIPNVLQVSWEKSSRVNISIFSIPCCCDDCACRYTEKKNIWGYPLTSTINHNHLMTKKICSLFEICPLLGLWNVICWKGPLKLLLLCSNLPSKNFQCQIERGQDWKKHFGKLYHTITLFRKISQFQTSWITKGLSIFLLPIE